MFLHMRSRTVVGSWPADRLDFFNHAASAPAAIAAFDLFVETYGVKYGHLEERVLGASIEANFIVGSQVRLHRVTNADTSHKF